MVFTFTPAVRVAEHARLLLEGLPGAATLATALRLARGLAGENGVIGVADTERGTAARHADDHTFLHLRVDSCSPKAMPEVVAAAVAAGVDCLIVHSFSAFWSGRDGMLMLVDQHRKSPTQPGWFEARPHEQAMMDALLDYPGHLIATLRVKSDVVVGADATGRLTPCKVALKADHRDGLEYDFHLAAGVGLDGGLTVTSTCLPDTPDFCVGAAHPKPDADLGAQLADHLGRGARLPTVRDYLTRALDPTVTARELNVLAQEAAARGMAGLVVRNERGQSGPLGRLLTARRDWLVRRERASVRQTPPAPPAAPAPPAEGASGPPAPPAPGDYGYQPDDRPLVADMSLRAAHATTPDQLDDVEQDLADLDANDSISSGAHAHLTALINERRAHLTQEGQA
ncbi:hypothetical protein GCM10017673_38350 [Streptosporangium violaceochromogenes]|nr:hypothetical protein GCM10017673_38350 [Streptosporangium violaceochromogenes]